MKALILNGCTRKNGKTESLLKKFLSGLQETKCEIEVIDTVRNKVNPCTGCLACEKTGDCIIDDYMQEIYKKIEDSDIVVIASPVYFASVTAQLKAVIDRCQTLHSRRYILKREMKKSRKGYVVFTAGLSNPKEIASMEVLSKFFMLSCNATLEEMIYAMNTDREGISEEKLSEVYEIGRNVN